MSKVTAPSRRWYYSTAAAVPVLAAAFASIMLAGIVLRWVTSQTDELAQVAQRRAIQYAVDAQAGQLAQDQREAEARDPASDSGHAVARRLATFYRHERVYLLTLDGHVEAGWSNGRKRDRHSLRDVALELPPARASDAEPSTQLAKVDGRLAIIGVLRLAHGTTVVSARFLDDAFLRDAAQRGSLGAISVRTSGAGGDQSLMLRGTDGKPLAYLVWNAVKPGSRMLAGFWPVAAVAALAAVLVMSLLVRHLDRTTTELKKREAEARALARQDQLTKLPNRQHLSEHLDEALTRVRAGDGQIAILCLDLDRFKLVNDTLGHPSGDRLLCEFVQRLRGIVRASDFIARVGGDEFVVVQHNVNCTRDVVALCERILSAAQGAFDLDGTQAFVGVSIGVVRSPPSGGAAAELLRTADIALYEAKSEGRACYRVFDQDMDDRVRVRRAVEHELREAIESGTQLELLYQPLVSARSHETIGVEALIRWYHPVRGLISPAQFIPIAEETGLIHALGEWVMRQACGAAARMPSIRMSINLSPAQFRDASLPERLIEIAVAAGADPACMDLEITEGVFFGNEQIAGQMLGRLRAAGFGIALDDFGAGYSSLSYLTRFRIDKIKIDRSFVQRLAASAETLAVVQAVCALGASLGLRVTAEGVETAEQLQLLETIGVDEMQGYLFARPLTTAALDAHLAAPGSRQLRSAG